MRTWLVLAALLALVPDVSAQTLPWRRQIERRLDEHDRLIRQLLEQRPVPGAPRQELPTPGAPKQDLPTPGDPAQPLPSPGTPRQDLPRDQPPRQALPAGPQPYTRSFIRALFHGDEPRWKSSSP